MHGTYLKWADRVWNPVTGCYSGCKKCWKRSNTTKRFSSDSRMNKAATSLYRKDGELYILDKKFVSVGGSTLSMPFEFEPTYYRYRLSNLDSLKSGFNVAVCTQGELFAPWVPDWVIEEIFEECKKHPLNHYLFTTCYRERYEALAREGKLPKGDQFWYGVTNPYEADKSMELEGYHKFLLITNDLTEARNYYEWIITNNHEPPENAGNAAIFYDGSQESEYPAELLKKQISEKRSQMWTATCMVCGHTSPTKDMIAILARKKRGTSAMAVGYMHEGCFKKFCSDSGVDGPEFKGKE